MQTTTLLNTIRTIPRAALAITAVLGAFTLLACLMVAQPLWDYSEIPRQKWGQTNETVHRERRRIPAHAPTVQGRPSRMDADEPDIHYASLPVYYYYDVLHRLKVLTKLGYGDDERVRDAAHLVMSKRRPDGRWVLEGDCFSEPSESGRWLKPKRGEGSSDPTDPWGNSLKGAKKFDLEQVGKPSKWVTLNSYRALTLMGELETSAR